MNDRPVPPDVDDELVYVDEYVPPTTHPLLVGAGVVALIVAAVTSMAWFADASGLGGGGSADDQVLVPQVIELPEPEAMAALVDAGLEVVVVPERNVAVANRVVFGQDPTAGQSVDPGTVVELRVSMGDTVAIVPDVTGSLIDDLPAQLERYSLAVGEVSYRTDAGSAAGEVIEQSPPAGESLLIGAAVAVVVSEGPPPVEVPDVEGLTQDEATVALTELGFEVAPQRRYSGSVRFGRVIGTDPDPGDEADYGSEVRIFVSGGRPPVTTPPTTTPTTPTTPPVTTPGGGGGDDDGGGGDDGGGNDGGGEDGGGNDGGNGGGGDNGAG
ncbi:MAG: PASTA domain-containing protein [Acidimicrobiia bacterium]|nr:PASTA domain-containing protein [Acidimicrobiia bacterium]